MVDEEKNNSFKELLTQIEMGLELYDDLLPYKLENFSEHEFIVSDFIIGSAKKGKVQLSVAASILDEEER